MDEFWIVAARRQDGQTPKLAKAMHDKFYLDVREARVAANGYEAKYDSPFGVYRFVADECEMPRALCKFRGMLVIAEVSVRNDGAAGSCPECGATRFYKNAGWTECDCGFAYLSSDIAKLAAEPKGE